MKLLEIIIYTYLLCRPYYFFKSGTLQISDIIFLAGFFIFVIISAKNKTIMKESINNNIYYLLFLICVFAVNSIYFLIYFDYSFIVSSLYYLFNFFIIILFSFLIKKENFLKSMNSIIKVNLIIQLLLYVSGIGRYMDNTFRYMGTFNDPNQFAYYVLISYCFIFLLEQQLKINKNRLLLYFFVSFILIFAASSTGMLLGIMIIGFLSFLDFFINFPKFIKQKPKFFLSVFYILMIGAIVLCIKPEYINIISSKIVNSHIFNRVEEKIEKTNNESNNLWHDRGYDIIFAYPKYIIYGAGQGKYIRFYEKTGLNMEIHATLPSILFYYGLVSTFLIIIWIYKKIRGLPFRQMIVYIALFAESFTLLNQRQSLFWIFILLGYSFKRTKPYNGGK